MHELSLANEVIKIAEQEAKNNKALQVSEVTIEAGIFCGVEIETFRSALEMISEGSVLAGASLKIDKIKGRGYCQTCKREFEMNSRFEKCPDCSSFPSEIRNGYEFRVVSLVVEKE